MDGAARILVVDDVALNRRLLRTVVEGGGWLVEEVCDGVECVERCLLGPPPTLVLLDIMMPRMDGIEALSKIRNQYSRQELPVIIVTTQSEEVGLSAALKAGANDYVSKPLIRDVLLARVGQQLELRKCYADLERLQHELKLDMVSTFALGVAHNFNNCFASILGAAELIKRGAEGNAKLNQYTELIRRAVDGGVGFTKKLSAIVKANSSDASLTKEHLGKVLEDFALTQKAQVGERIEFPLHLGELPPQLAVDDRTLQGLLSIVVTNAVEAIATTGEVRITAQHGAGDEFLMLTVSDTGEGMDPVVLQRVFEPFFSTKNLDRVGGVSIQGNGLGLWNAYHMLKLLGGDIRISSEKGRGTEVLMLVPVARPISKDGCNAASDTEPDEKRFGGIPVNP